MKPAMKDWNHLTLAEVREVEALSLRIVGSLPCKWWQDHGRLADLLMRRVDRAPS